MAKGARTQRFPFIPRSNLRRAAVICHRNADADAYLSAYGLSTLLRKSSPKCLVDIVAPGGMTTLTTKLSKKFPHRIVEVSADEYDLYVAVDVGDTELLKDWKGKMMLSDGVKVLVDHHPLRESGLYDRALVDEDASSAGEMVFRLFEESRSKPDPLTAQALLEAIMFDSSHLAIATPGALKGVVKLIDAGADIGEARKDLRSEPDRGEAIAKLKGAQRSELYRVGDWVVATSRVGSFQAHVARALVSMGADVAVVGGETDGETRVSFRSTQRFFETTKLHLGSTVAEEVAKKFGGHGGGHATAASLSARVTEEEAMKEAAGKIAEELGARLEEIR